MPAASEPRTHAEMLARRQMALIRQENAAQRARVAKARTIAERSRIALDRMHRSESGRAALIAAVRPRVEIRFDPDEVHAILPPEVIDRSPRRIIARVAIEHGVSSAEILGRHGSKAVIRARRAAILAVHEEHRGCSMIRLGQIFGLDHTTILYALRRVGGATPAEARETKARARA